MTFDGFYPTLAQWFRAAYGAPTRGEIAAWPSITKQLLGRYGVVLGEILEREGALAPWRELMVGYCALGARGEPGAGASARSWLVSNLACRKRSGRFWRAGAGGVRAP